jgi:GAF domain-containing protein
VHHAGALRTIALYGAHTTGDRPNQEEVQLLKTLAAAAGHAYERAEVLALRKEISALREAVPS